MIDANHGNVQAGLAAYNAGQDRVASAVSTSQASAPAAIAAASQDTNADANTVLTNIKNRQAQDDADPIAANWDNLTSRNAPVDPKTGKAPYQRNVDDAVTELMTKGKQFADIPSAELSDTLQELMTRGNINASEAQALVEQHGYPQVQGWLKSIYTLGLGESSVQLKDNAVQQSIDKINDGSYAKQGLDTVAGDAISASINSAKQVAASTLSDLQRLQERAQTVPGAAVLFHGHCSGGSGSGVAQAGIRPR